MNIGVRTLNLEIFSTSARKSNTYELQCSNKQTCKDPIHAINGRNFRGRGTLKNTVTASYVGTKVRWGAQTPLKTQNWASTPPKRSAHPSRVRRGCFDPPPPKIEAVGCANPYPPSKNFFHSGR